jgi:hypothetical protein
MIMLAWMLGGRWVLRLRHAAGRHGLRLQGSLLITFPVVLAGFQVADSLLQLLDAFEEGLNTGLG